jgi:hypothetical protein
MAYTVGYERSSAAVARKLWQQGLAHAHPRFWAAFYYAGLEARLDTDVATVRQRAAGNRARGRYGVTRFPDAADG